jgi:hypothetical protein
VQLEQLERLEHLHQNINRRGITGYILAKRIYPKSPNLGLRFLVDLGDRLKAHSGHACGPKAAEGPPGHG